MGKIQLFLTNFYEMTFKGKGMFWGILAAALFLFLVYVYAERIRELAKDKKKLLLIVPALLLAGGVFMFIHSSQYVPIPDRTADNPVSYDWEQTAEHTDGVLAYTTDVKNPATGTVYDQQYSFTPIKEKLYIVVGSEHVQEESFTVKDADGKTSVIFNPDGAYCFRVEATGEEEWGHYAFADKVLTMTRDSDGAETTAKIRTAAKLKYQSAISDPDSVAAYKSPEFNLADLREMLGSGEGKVTEAYTVVSKDERTAITFNPDGTYRFYVVETNEEETGLYAYADKALTLTCEATSLESKASKSAKTLKYKTEIKDPSTIKPFEPQYSGIADIENKCIIKEAVERAVEDYTAVSRDETTSLTFFRDGTFRFAALDGGAEETGWYVYRNETLTMSNSEGSAAFWKNARSHYIWLIFGGVLAAGSILLFVYNDRIKAFMNRHPLTWLLIPAALLIYFVYVSIGWNIWVSVSDWPEGSLKPSYGWNSDAWKFKASGDEMTLRYKADGLEVDMLEFGKPYEIVKEKKEDTAKAAGTEAAQTEQAEENAQTDENAQTAETAEAKEPEKATRTAYFSIAVKDLEAALSSGAEEEFSSDNDQAFIAFKADGTFAFRVPSDGYTENGRYTYENGNLTLLVETVKTAAAEQPAEAAAVTEEIETTPINAVMARDKYTTHFKILAEDFIWDEAADEDSPAYVQSTVAYASENEGEATLTLNADGTYAFEVPESDYKETGVYRYQSGTLTVENATGGSAAWKSFASGFTQYSKMFKGATGQEFLRAVKNTLLLFLIIPFCLLLGMGLALIMDQGLRGTSVFRTLILLPFALSFVVTGLIWRQMFTSEMSGGILAGFFKLFGVSLGVNWTSNELVMFSIMLVMIWQFSGYVAVIFLAAIKNVPTNIINAAKLDGSYMPRVYWKMIIPQMKGAMGSCITILAMYALRSFDLIYSLTGVTNNATKTLPIMMYVEAFSNNNFAYAAAISCFLLALVLVLILPLTYLTNRRKK